MVYFKTFLENHDQFSLIFDYIIIVSPENDYDKNDFESTIQKLNEIGKTTEIFLYYVHIDGTKNFYDEFPVSKKSFCLKTINLSVVEKIITCTENDSGVEFYSGELSKIYDECSSLNHPDATSSHEITSSLSNDSPTSNIKNQSITFCSERNIKENHGDKRFLTPTNVYDLNKNKCCGISSNKQYNIFPVGGNFQNGHLNKNIMNEWFLDNKSGNSNESNKANYEQNGKLDMKSINSLNYMNLESKLPFIMNNKSSFSSTIDKNKHCKYERERRERIKDCCNILRKIIPRDDRIKTKKDMASVLENTVLYLQFIQMNIPESVQLSLNKMYIEHTLLSSCKIGDEIKKQEFVVKKDIPNESRGVNLLKMNDNLIKNNNLYSQNRANYNEFNKENKFHSFMKNYNTRIPFTPQQMNNQNFYNYNYKIPIETNIKDQNDFLFNNNHINIYNNRSIPDIMENQSRIFDNFARHENNNQLNMLLSNVMNNESSLNKEWNSAQLDKNIQQTR